MTDIDNLLKRLNSRRASVREEALREADTLTPEQLTEMVQKAANLTVWQMLKVQGAIFATLIVNALITTYILLDVLKMPELIGRTGNWFLNLAISSFTGTITCGLYYYFLFWKHQPHAHRSLLQLLKNKTGVEHLDVLLKMYGKNFLGIWKDVESVIPQKFLELEIGETEDLVFRYKHTFCWMLKKPYQAPNFTIHILKVMTNVGDASVVPTVRRLIRLRTDNSHAEDIQQAAKACLAAIESRQMNHNETQTLLRPSEKTVGGTELLRPVASRPDTEPQQLLRASQKQESGMPE